MSRWSQGPGAHRALPFPLSLSCFEKDWVLPVQAAWPPGDFCCQALQAVSSTALVCMALGDQGGDAPHPGHRAQVRGRARAGVGLKALSSLSGPDETEPACPVVGAVSPEGLLLSHAGELLRKMGTGVEKAKTEDRPP